MYEKRPTKETYGGTSRWRPDAQVRWRHVSAYVGRSKGVWEAGGCGRESSLPPRLCMCVCVDVCVGVWVCGCAGGSEQGRVRGSVYVCVCVDVCEGG